MTLAKVDTTDQMHTGNGVKVVLTEIAKSIVSNSEQVQVVEVSRASTILLELSVAKEDLGKVIGKRGQTARAIRTIMTSVAAKTGKRVFVEIAE